MTTTTNQREIKLAVVDDHDSFRSEIVNLLNAEVDFEVILEASNGLELLEKVKVSVPAIVLMDLRMPKMDGIEATEKLSLMMPHIKIIAYTQYDYEENIIAMFLLGVQSFIGKSDALNELINAIRIVSNGGVYLTEIASGIIKNGLKRLQESTKNTDSLVKLSKSERQLLEYICSGLSSTEIASLLYKSPRTVEKYREELYRKLNVCGKKELIRLGLGIIFETNR